MPNVLSFQEFKEQRAAGKTVDDLVNSSAPAGRSQTQQQAAQQEAAPSASAYSPATMPKNAILSFDEFNAQRAAGVSLDDLIAGARGKAGAARSVTDSGTGTAMTPADYAKQIMANEGQPEADSGVASWLSRTFSGITDAAAWMREEGLRRAEAAKPNDVTSEEYAQRLQALQEKNEAAEETYQQASGNTALKGWMGLLGNAAVQAQAATMGVTLPDDVQRMLAEQNQAYAATAMSGRGEKPLMEAYREREQAQEELRYMETTQRWLDDLLTIGGGSQDVLIQATQDSLEAAQAAGNTVEVERLQDLLSLYSEQYSQILRANEINGWTTAWEAEHPGGGEEAYAAAVQENEDALQAWASGMTGKYTTMGPSEARARAAEEFREELRDGAGNGYGRGQEMLEQYRAMHNGHDPADIEAAIEWYMMTFQDEVRAEMDRIVDGMHLDIEGTAVHGQTTTEEWEKLVEGRMRAMANLQYAEQHRYDDVQQQADFHVKSGEGREAFEASDNPWNDSTIESNRQYLASEAARLGYDEAGIEEYVAENLANIHEFDEHYRDPDERWTEEEKGIFYYLYATDPERAAQYGASVNKRYNAGEYAERVEGWQELATRNFWTGLGSTIAGIGGHLVGGLPDTIRMGYEILAHGDAYSSQYQGISRYGDEVTSAIAQDLNDRYGTINTEIPILKGIFNGKGLGDAYQVFVSMAQSAASIALGGEAGSLAMFFGDAASSTLSDCLRRGMNPEKALVTALAAGTAEVLFEKVSVENLLSNRGLMDFWESGVGLTILKQAGIEASEELSTELANEFADRWINGGYSEYEERTMAYIAQGMDREEAGHAAWVDVGYKLMDAALSGALSGAGMSAGHYASYAIPAKMDTYSGNAQELIDAAAMSDVGSLTHRTGEQARADYEATGSISRFTGEKLQALLDEHFRISDIQRGMGHILDFFRNLKNSTEASTANTAAAQAEAPAAETGGEARRIAEATLRSQEVTDSGTGARPAQQQEQETPPATMRAEEVTDSGTGARPVQEQAQEQEQEAAPALQPAQEVTDSGTGARPVQERETAPAERTETGEKTEAVETAPVSTDERNVAQDLADKAEAGKADTASEEQKSEAKQALEAVQGMVSYIEGQNDSMPEGLPSMSKDEAERQIVALGEKLGVKADTRESAEEHLKRATERVKTYTEALSNTVEAAEKVEQEQKKQREEIVGNALSRSFTGVTELTEGETKTLRDLFLNGKNEMKLSQFTAAARAAYNAGLSGVSYEQALSAAGDRGGLTPSQFRTAWELGARKAGQEVSSSDLQSALAMLGSQAGEVEAAYQAGQDVSDYAAGMNKLISAVAATGRNAQDIVNAAQEGDVMRSLTPEQIALAQRLGDERGSERRGKVRNRAERRAEQRRTAEKISAPQERAGRVVVETEGGTVGQFRYDGVDESKLSGKQKVILEAAKMIAEATGLEIRVIKAVGTMGGAYQGNGVIYLNIASGMNLARFSKAIAAGSLAHEMTHFLQEYAPEQYDELRDYIVGSMNAGELDRLVRQQQATQPGLSYDAAVDEIVANACQPLLRDTKAIQELALEHRSLAEKIKDFIKSFVDKIKAAFADVDFHDRLPIYQAVQAVEKNLADIQGLWDEALREAAKNLQAETAVGAASEEELQQIEEDEDLPLQSWDEMTDEEQEQTIQENRAFNNGQTRTGSPLKTLKGSDISRGGTIQKIRYPVGKVIGGRLYLHKSYVDTAIAVNPEFGEALTRAEQALLDVYPEFEYTCLNYHPASGEIQFQQAPGFDTEREPVVGYQVNVAADGTVTMANRGKPFGQIWHHKWQWVDNDYKGFDVRESWAWSREWLNTILGASKGGSINAWNKQLAENGLPEQEKTVRYQLILVDPVQPSSDEWQRTLTEPEALAIYPDMWDTSKAKQEETEEEKKKRDSTQRENTLSTYRNIYNILKGKGFTGRILDASSGLGFGTALGRSDEFGFNVEDIEPYPGEYKGKRYVPMYTDYSTLHEQYDAIISSAVLNVVAQDQRDALVVKMGQLLKPGGQMYVTTRTTKDDVDNLAKNKKNVQLGPHEFIETVHNHYQKGFTNTELRAYLQDALGDEFIVEIAKGREKFNNNTAVIATKKGQITLASTDLERYELLKRASVKPAIADVDAIGDDFLEKLSSFDELKASGLIRGRDLTEVQDVMRKLATKLEINRINLENSSLSFPFSFSNRNVGKSTNHQKQYSGLYTDLAKALTCIRDLVDGAQLIETHREKKVGTTKENTSLKQTYVLLGALRDGSSIIPVEMVVKEFYTEGSGLYMTVSLSKTKDLGVLEKASAGKAAATQSLFPKSEISIQDLIRNVNADDSRLLKYFPDQMLSEAQSQYKYDALERQQRDYDAMREVQLQAWDDGPVYNDRALVSEETLDKWLSGGWFGSNTNPNYAQAFIAYMTPAQFLRLTTIYDTPRVRAESEGRTVEWAMDVSKSQPIQLHMDTETGKVWTHEGRHRMVVLERAGVTDVPVLIFDSSNKYSKEPMKEFTLYGEDSNGNRNYSRATVYDMLPLNNAHRAEIVDQFSKQKGFERQYEKALGNKQVRFQLMNDVEMTDRLVAVHNVTEEKLLGALKLGGLPMPSIAVIRAGTGHSNYGPISIVFGRETVDPQADRRNRLYGADAWTPTFVDVERPVNTDFSLRAERRFNDLAGRVADGMFASTSPIRRHGIDSVTSMDFDELVQRLANDETVKAAYAAEHGISVPVARKTVEYGSYGTNTVRLYIDTIGAEKLRALEEQLETGEWTISDEDMQTIRDVIEQGLLDKGTKPEVAKRRAEMALQHDRWVKFINDAWAYQLNNGKRRTEVDPLETSNTLNEKVRETDVQAWLRTELDGILGEPGIRNSVDRFTPDGRRRTFRQTHEAYTLANIVKAMSKGKNERGENAHTTATGIQSITAPEYRTVEEARADSGRLGRWGEEAYAAELKAVEDKLSDFIDDVEESNDVTFGYFAEENINDLLMKAARTDRSAAALKRIFKADSDLNLTDAQVKTLQEIYNDAARLPTEYFEAKPQRAVGFNEVVAAIVPSNLRQGTRDALAEAGVRTEEYKAGDEDDRLAKLNGLQEAQFQTWDEMTEGGTMQEDLQTLSEAQDENGQPLFQIFAYLNDEQRYRDMLERWGGMKGQDEIDELFDMVDEAAEKIRKNLEALDFSYDRDIDDRTFAPVKNNSDALYVVSLDFSTLCRKRILQQAVAEKLSAALNRAVTKEEGITIRDALMKLQEEGKQIEVACALCYVESARMRSQKSINEFLKNREKAMREYFAFQSGQATQAEAEAAEREAIANENRTPDNPQGLIRGKNGDMIDIRTAKIREMPDGVKKRVQAAKKAARLSFPLTAEQQEIVDTALSLPATTFTTAAGLEDLAKNHYDIFKAYIRKVSAASKSKGIENDVWYRFGDANKISDSIIEKMNAENGLRTQSWSDFQVKHLMDYITATMELAVRGAKMHAYTKVPDYVRLMGETGVMINMSLIPAREFTEGRLEYDNVEGFVYDTAMDLRKQFPETAGTICIGMDPRQVRLLLESTDIDYVIPYHQSGMSKATRALMHIPSWKDFQNFQGEKKVSGEEARRNAERYGVELLSESDPKWHEKPAFSEWFDLKKAQATQKRVGTKGKYGVMTGGYAAMQEAAERYKQMCAERGLLPKFSYNEEHNFADEPGYWKLLIDRKMVNNVAGNVIEQKALQPKFNRDTIQSILDEELKRWPGVKADQEEAIDRVVEAFSAGRLKAGMNADQIAAALEKPIDNLKKVSILESAGEVQTEAAEPVMQIIGEDAEDSLAEARGRELANARIQSENALVDETVKGLQEIVSRQKTTIEKLLAKMRRSTTPEVREGDARKLARALIEQYASEANVGDVAGKLKAVGDMLLQSEKLDGQALKNAAREAAREILSQSYTDPNTERDTYKEIAKWIRSAKLVIDPEDMGELNGGWSEFHKRNFGRINVASRENVAGKSGYQEIDSFYEEMATQFAGYVPPASQLNTRGEMLQEMEELVRMAQPEKALTYGLYMDEMVEQLANRIVLDAMDGVMRRTAPTMGDRNAALRDEIKALQKELNMADREAASLYRTIYDLTMLLDRADSRYTSLAKEAEIRMAEARENSMARIAELKAKHLADTTKLKEHFLQVQKNAAERRNESAGVKKYRKQIEKKAKALYELLATNSDEKHVPEVLKTPLAEFLESLDFTSRRALSGGPETRRDAAFGARLLRLQQILENQQRALEGDGDVKQDLGGYIDVSEDNLQYLRDVAELITQALTENRDFTINDMTADELRKLSELLSNLSAAIRGMNAFMANARFESVREAADRDITNMELLGKAGPLENGAAVRFLGWEEGVPYYVFRRFGAGGVSIFDGLTRGWEKMAMNAQEIIGFTEKTYTDKEVREWKREIREFTLEDGRKIRMTVGQIMALSQLLGRAQALQHIERGGIRIGDIETKKGKLSDAEHYHLTADDIINIVGSLTDRQIQVAQELRHYMATKGSEWGNEISMRRFGYNFYGQEGDTYFPIQTDSNDRPMADTDAQKNSMFRLLNLSASKSLNPKASNALIVNDIFDVFSDHMADMAKLNGMGLPILDAIKWFSYKQRIDIDEAAGSYTTRTLQGAMENAFGAQALRWFKTLMKDINGQTESGDRGTNLFTKFLGNYKAAAVAANLRVALLQPTSYVRATTVLKPQYLAAALGMKSGYSEAMKWSGTAVWKSLGYYDTDISKSMRAQIQHDDSLRDKIVEKSMVMAEFGDKWTWGRLWNACKLQVKAENKGLSGDDLMRATADLFREVVYSSQVMDATLTRSEIMRGKSAMSKMSSAFMAEPTLSYNIVLDAASSLMTDRRRYGRAAWGRNARKLGKAFTVYTASAAFAALVESLADAFRDDDDDDFWQKWIEAFWGENGQVLKGNFAQDMLFVNKLPFFKDLLSIIQGYASNNMSISAFVTALDAYRIWVETYKLSTGELEKATKVTSYGSMTQWGKVYKTLQAISQLSGIAVSNASRDALAIWNTAMQIAGHEEMKVRRYESSTDRKYGEFVRGTGVSRSQYGSILEEGTAQDELGPTLEEMIRNGKLTEAQANAIWDSRGWKKSFSEWQAGAAEAAAKAEEQSRLVAATGLSAERYEEVMTEANADGNTNVSQAELGEYLLAGIRSGTFTAAQAELIWNTRGWKTGFSAWRSKNS